MRVQDLWYGKHWFVLFLLPLSWLFGLIASLRRLAYRNGLLRSQALPVPVIIVGNITVGGTGKTPLVIWLVEHLKTLGRKPGVIARGYRGSAKTWPQQVRPDSDPQVVGDEAVMLARRTQVPVCVGPDRVVAAQALLGYTQCDVIVSDDGMQHYALQRDIEILVVDGEKRFGNGFLLPAGPLREPIRRKKCVDFIVANGQGLHGEHRFKLVEPKIKRMRGREGARPLSHFKGQKVHAVAGLGQPERFFYTLRKHNLRITEHPFPDHHLFLIEDLTFADNDPILMTEKDAVKCERFMDERFWVVSIDVEPDKTLIFGLGRRLNQLFAQFDEQKTTRNSGLPDL